MTTLFPPGYGGFPSYQFSSPNQVNNRYYADAYRRRDMTFAPRYPTQPFYQPPFNPTMACAAAQSYRDGRPGLGAQLVNAVNEMDYRYRQQQYQRKLAKIQRQYWNLQNNAIPPVPYPEPLPAPPLNYGRGTLFEYERETEFLPFPGYTQRGGGFYGGQTTLGYGQGWGTGFGATTTLPPKIRVIFVPTGHSYAQQSYTGPLAMPPFLYNRMAQPLSSCPPPPPLPQLGMLPLTPAVQQMVLQRYSNPVAVLPYSSNWQTPQMMMPSFYSPFQQQQQQQQQQPVSAFQSFLPAPQPSMLPCMPAYPSAPSIPQPSLSFPAPAPMPAQFCPQLPPAPQSYIPPLIPTAPVQAFPQLSPAPQPFIAPPMQPAQYYSSLPPAPQPYIPSPNNIQGVSSAYAPPVTAANQYPSPLSSSQISSSYGTSSLSPSTSSDNSLSSYPSICRACPPAPPPLSITVSGHCWVQHCAACHHVPTTDTNPNSRPAGGRCTPLLRYPTVPQYVPDQTQQYQMQSYTNTNAPVVSRPWLRKTPPLPPNCFILSDRHFNRDGTISQYPEPRREHRSRRHGSHSKRRSMTTAARAIPMGNPHAPTPSKSISPRRASRSFAGEKPAVKDQNVESHGSLSNSSSGLSTEYQKTTMLPSPVQKYPSPVQKENVPEPVAKEARNVNLQYSYQPQELPSVYNTNRYLRSGSESSGLSWSNRRSPNYSLSSSSDLQTVKSESRKPPRSSNHSKTYTEKLIIIREVVPDSPCSVSTISSNATFRIIDKDADSLSTTSTFEGNQLSGDEDLHSETL